MRYILVTSLADGRRTEHDGRFLVSFDVDRNVTPSRRPDGVWRDPSLVTTDDPAEALRFEAVADAHAYWTRTSSTTPVRLDGKPNRPFTAYTIQIVDPESDPNPLLVHTPDEVAIVHAFDPATKDEYTRLFEERTEVFGEGIEVGQRVPCPFCAAPGWKQWRIVDMTYGDYSGMADVSTCSNCGRSARFKVDLSDGGVRTELIQTGGVNPPAYLHPWPEREARPDVVDGQRRRMN